MSKIGEQIIKTGELQFKAISTWISTIMKESKGNFWHFGIESSVSQCKAYKNHHNIVSGLDCRFKKDHKLVNKGKKIGLEQYEKCKATISIRVTLDLII